MVSDVNGKFITALISNETDKANNKYSFKELLRNFGDDKIDILKIDIEGSEFAIADEILSIPVCQLLIELHHTDATKALKLLHLFSSRGFYLFSHENNGLIHHVSEYSFIHERCFETYEINVILGKYLS